VLSSIRVKKCSFLWFGRVLDERVDRNMGVLGCFLWRWVID
jgi:hypothetical protein